MSKLSASRGVVCAFCIVPVTLVAMALLVMVHGRNGKAERASTSASSSPSGTSTAAARSRMQASYAALPLAFEPNQGQTDAQVKYLARGSGYTLFLTANDAVFSLRSRQAKKESNAVVRMHLAGGNSQAKIEGGDSLPGVANYYLGNDPSKWSTGVPRFGRVAYRDVYPGVNLAFHGTGHELEFDFVVAPGANATPIAFRFSGNRGMKTDDAGNLIVTSAAGNVTLRKPVAYQERSGTREVVDARFALKASNQVGFELGNYDRSRELVIDPSVSYAYSSYLGGSENDAGYGIAVDNYGNAYITGQTASPNFPGVTNTLKSTAGNAFVTKISADGSGLVYSTYVGGTGTGGDSGNAIAVNPTTGATYVAGATTSSDFPTTTGAYQTKIVSGALGNAFVFQLNPAGSIAYCTYLGGEVNDSALGIALDSSGDAYVVGKTSSTKFPTAGTTVLQKAPVGGFLSELNPAGAALVFSTYLGGSTNDFATALALDSSANVYVTGSTTGTTFPGATTKGFQPTFGGGATDAFVAAISANATAYLYFTFLGGSNTDIGNGIAVDSSGDAYVTGETASSTNFPTKSPEQTAGFGGGTYDAFVTELTPAGALVYSTFLGGTDNDTGVSIAVDASNNAYVTGQTDSPAPSPFSAAGATQGTLGGGFDAFVSELNSGGSALVFSTYLGGSLDEDDGGKIGAVAVDGKGYFVYVTGNTGSTSSFPVITPVPYPGGSTFGGPAGGTDAFAVKYAQGPVFSMTATTPAAVAPGSSGTSTVSLKAYNGYSSPVALSCSVTGTGTPLPACSATSFNPASPVTPTASGAATTLTITTTGATAATLHPSKIFYAMWLPVSMSLLGMSFAGSRMQRKKLFGLLMIVMVMAALFAMPACGGSSGGSGGGGGGGGGSAGTPAGSYTVTITGTGSDTNAVTQTAQVTLTVN